MKPDLFNKKLLALALLAGGTLFAAPAVGVGIDIGAIGAPPPPPASSLRFVRCAGSQLWLD